MLTMLVASVALLLGGVGISLLLIESQPEGSLLFVVGLLGGIAFERATRIYNNTRTCREQLQVPRIYQIATYHIRFLVMLAFLLVTFIGGVMFVAAIFDSSVKARTGLAGAALASLFGYFLSIAIRRLKE